MSINGGGGYYEGNSIGGREVNVPPCMQGNRLQKNIAFLKILFFVWYFLRMGRSVDRRKMTASTALDPNRPFSNLPPSLFPR